MSEEPKDLLIRKPKSTEWTMNAIHEFKETLREEAVHLIEQTEDKGIVRQMVIEHIQLARANIQSLFDREAPNPDIELDEVSTIDPNIIDQEFLKLITEEVELIRRELQSLFVGKGYTEIMGDIPFVQMGFLRVIAEMKTRVRRATAKPIRKYPIQKRTLEKFTPEIQDMLIRVRDIDIYAVNNKVLRRLINAYVQFCGYAKGRAEVAKEIGLEDPLTDIINRSNKPKEQYKINDGIKLRNWMLKKALELAKEYKLVFLIEITRNI